MPQVRKSAGESKPDAERSPGHRPRHAARGDNAWQRRTRKRTLADEITAAAYELFDSVDQLHYCHDWPYEPAEQRAFDAVRHARRAISRGGEMTEATLLQALLPVTHEWWPELSPLVADARAAVERIRRAVIVAKYEPGHRFLDSTAA